VHTILVHYVDISLRTHALQCVMLLFKAYQLLLLVMHVLHSIHDLQLRRYFSSSTVHDVHASGVAYCTHRSMQR
jgi:hypothetical protein